MSKQKKIFNGDNHHYFKIGAVIFASILFFVTISHIGTVGEIVKKILGILLPIILGFAFAFILNMPLKFFEERVFGRLTRKNGKVWRKLKRPVCLLISLVLIFASISVLLAFVIPEFTKTCEKFFMALPSAMANLNEKINTWLKDMNLDSAFDNLNIDWNSVSSWALNILHENQNQITTGAFGFITVIFTSIVNFILALALSIYILSSKESLGRVAKSFIYAIMKRERAGKFISFVVLTNKSFAGFVVGQCVEVMLIGVLCFIGMLIFRMPYAIMVSCIIAVTQFVPVFGPFVGTAIGAFLILIESPIKALWFVVFIVVMQQLESNILYPKIMGKHVGIPGICVLIAVTIGGGLFGVVGIILSVPVCGVIYTLSDRWIKKRLEERNICRRSMSHDSSEPKTIAEQFQNYDFEAPLDDDDSDTADDVYTDDGEVRKIYDEKPEAEDNSDNNDITIEDQNK